MAAEGRTMVQADLSDRQLSATRVFDAPREMVFKVWTQPQHIAQWWGPRGFTTTTTSMDARPGGQWRFVMHGPDGRDYPNLIKYVEVIPPQRLVYQHAGEGEHDAVNFEVTVTFTDLGHQRTRLDMVMLFPSAEEKDFTIREYGADEGLTQTLERLREHLASQ